MTPARSSSASSIHDSDAKLALLDRVGFKRYFKASSWEEYNRQFFDGLAPKYDFLNEILSFGLHRRIKQRAIANMNIRPGSRILDLCTGSGDIALFIARAYPSCSVIGVDVSERMLEIARARAAGLTNIEFAAGDAAQLPYDEGTFDAAFMGFGLRNLANLENGLSEMRRVTKDGGCVTSLDLGKPQGRVKGWIYRAYFYRLIPMIGLTFFHRGEFNSFHYLPESNKCFPSQEQLVELFQSAGLRGVSNHNFLFGAIAQQIGRVQRSARQ